MFRSPREQWLQVFGHIPPSSVLGCLMVFYRNSRFPCFGGNLLRRQNLRCMLLELSRAHFLSPFLSLLADSHDMPSTRGHGYIYMIFSYIFNHDPLIMWCPFSFFFVMHQVHYFFIMKNHYFLCRFSVMEGAISGNFLGIPGILRWLRVLDSKDSWCRSVSLTRYIPWWVMEIWYHVSKFRFQLINDG